MFEREKTMKNKISMLVLALCMVFALSVFTVGIAAALPDGYEGYTEIADEAGLRTLMGSTDADVLAGKYVLTANITLGADSQSPIGTADAPFTGVFDGHNHTVSGVNLSGAANVGFFGATSGATVKNLTLAGKVTATGEMVGGFIGLVKMPLTIENCTNRVEVKGAASVGGFVGYVESVAGQALAVTSCTNDAAVTATAAAGSKGVGGFTGHVYNITAGSPVTIVGFTNTKNGAISGATDVGGLAGRLSCGGATSVATVVKQCENYGDITATGAYVGGLFGFVDSNGTAASIKKFSELYNAGTVSAKGKYKAGIIGILRSYVNNQFTLSDSMSVGKISDTGNVGVMAGILGGGNLKATAYAIERVYNGGVMDTSSTSSVSAICAAYSKGTLTSGYFRADCGASDAKATKVTLASTVAENRALLPGLAESNAWIITNGDPIFAYQHPEHNYVNGVCTVCGEADPSACAHTNKLDEILTPATCVATGIKNVVCANCSEVLEKNVVIPIDADNHASAGIWEKNTDGKYDCVCPDCGKALINGQAEQPTIHIKKGGSDKADGLTADTAVETLPEAVKRIAGTGGTVHFDARVEITADVELPAYTETITFKGEQDAKGLAISGIVIVTSGKSLTLGGPSVFDGIVFKGNSTKTASLIRILANWNDVTFGYVRVHDNATLDFYAGKYLDGADNTEAKNVTINLDGAAMSTGNLDTAVFYRTIVLGSWFGAADQTVSNKTVTLNVGNGKVHGLADDKTVAASISTLYTMSSTSNNANATCQTPNCATIVNLNGKTVVKTLRTGDRNVNAGADYAGTGYLDSLTLNFNDNASLSATGIIRNAKNTVVNISGKADGRTVPLTKGIQFASFGAFDEGTEPAIITATYGSHSFAADVATPFDTATNGKDRYTLNENIVNECTFVPTVVDGAYVGMCECGRRGETLASLTLANTSAAIYSNDTAAVRYIVKLDAAAEVTVENYGIMIAQTAETVNAKSAVLTNAFEGTTTYAVDLVNIPKDACDTSIYAWAYVNLTGGVQIVLPIDAVTVNGLIPQA